MKEEALQQQLMKITLHSKSKVLKEILFEKVQDQERIPLVSNKTTSKQETLTKNETILNFHRTFKVLQMNQKLICLGKELLKKMKFSSVSRV